MEMTRKHLLSLAILTAFSPVLVTQAHAQLHLEIAKAPEEAPKIAIVPFSNDSSLYPIIETDLNYLKELGSDTSKLILDENSNLFLNLVSYPFSVTNVLTEKQARGFYSYLKFLNSKRFVTIHSNPFLTLSDNKETFFSVGSNIPFKTSSTDYQDTLSRNTSTVDYRDVGTEIKITPAVYDFTNVYLDLDIGWFSVILR
jgi:type II secretory pathway component GspD/PulD (secretin)